MLAALAPVLAEKVRSRRDHAAATFGALTEREQRLVREAAVMGYVNGVAFGPYRDHIPPDGEIVIEVIQCCRSNHDLYPLLGSES